jgi:hypothetical protein
VSCLRCRLALEFVIPTLAPYVSACNRCHLAYAVQLRTEILHERSATLAYLDVENCTAFDLLPSTYIVGARRLKMGFGISEMDAIV